LGQALTALKMDVHWLNRKLPEDQAVLSEKIKSMSGLIDTTVQSVRRISSELRPKLLDDLGLSAAMEWQAHEFMSRADIECTITSEPEDIILDRSRSTAFFRIVRIQRPHLDLSPHGPVRHNQPAPGSGHRAFRHRLAGNPGRD
jgi:two-component system, NarL family, sensor histidine kinase UhpB